MRYRLEIYDGAAWQDLSLLGGSGGDDYLRSVSLIITAINATNAGFNTLLAKIRTHGLIDT